MRYFDYTLTNEFAEVVEICVDDSQEWQAVYRGVNVTRLLSDEDVYTIEDLMEEQAGEAARRMMQREGSGYDVYK